MLQRLLCRAGLQTVAPRVLVERTALPLPGAALAATGWPRFAGNALGTLCKAMTILGLNRPRRDGIYALRSTAVFNIANVETEHWS